MLREGPVKTGTTFEEYIIFEQKSLVRHEFVDGNLFVVAGGIQRHNMLAGILYAYLLPKILAQGCRIFFNDVILKTPNGRGYYPDIFATCDSSDSGSSATKTFFRHRPCRSSETIAAGRQISDNVINRPAADTGLLSLVMSGANHPWREEPCEDSPI